jgi:3-oxoacyl-[acyl-carrier-protein] synthase II
VASACAAGADAIGTAVRMIRRGETDACLAGGADAGITPFFLASFTKLGALSPSGVPRPFDARRDGYVMGEGAGVLVLEEEDAARARGNRVLGRITGYGASADAYHLTAPEPHGRGAAAAMGLALRDAGIQPEDVDYVNAHGTATPLNDRAETAAIKRVFGQAAHGLPVSSLKSSIGHLLGAAGAVEAVATLSALRERIAPPTLNHEVPEEGLDLDYVPGAARPMRAANKDGRPAIGVSNSFGFGGHNSVLCLEAA